MAFTPNPVYAVGLPGVEIENSESLIGVLRFPETFRVTDFRDLIVELEARNPMRRKHAVLADMSAINPRTVSAQDRRDAAKVLKAHANYLAEVTLAEARIAPNPIIRGMLTVFDWAAPKPWPINNLFSGETAELWLRGNLAKLGLALPTQPVWHRAPQAPELR